MRITHKASVNISRDEHRYDVIIADRALEDSGQWVRHCLATKPRKIALVSNRKIFEIYGEIVVLSLKQKGFETFVWLMDDGEEYKNLNSLSSLLFFLGENRLARTDAVIALGGGVVGDLAGFASAVYLRGVSFLQIPTTFLAMIDSSVGGKTAINFEFGKNVIGSFHQPSGVLIDIQTLRTLETRELAAGFFEAVKQGAIGHDGLLEKTSAFLKIHPLDSFKDSIMSNSLIADLSGLIHSHVEFKLDIVRGDESENAKREDSHSRKILNFGHTVGHALEKVTGYKRFKHGEAVGYGMIAAAEISNKLEFFDTDSLNLLNDVVTSVGRLPETSQIEVSDVVEAISFDKKMIDESLQWILLKGIGKPTVVRQSEIPEQIIRETLTRILQE